MTGSACRNVPFWNSIFENLLSCRREPLWGPANWFGVEAVEFRGNSRHLSRAENVGYAKHDVVCPPPFDESSHLILDIFDLLSCEARDWIISKVTLPRWPMAVLTISNLGSNFVPRDGVFGASCRPKK
jgi:hypothetical protein